MPVYTYRLSDRLEYSLGRFFLDRECVTGWSERGLGPGMRLDTDRDVPIIHFPVLGGIGRYSVVGGYCEIQLHFTAVDSPSGQEGGATANFTGKRGLSQKTWHKRDEELGSETLRQCKLKEVTLAFAAEGTIAREGAIDSESKSHMVAFSVCVMVILALALLSSSCLLISTLLNSVSG